LWSTLFSIYFVIESYIVREEAEESEVVALRHNITPTIGYASINNVSNNSVASGWAVYEIVNNWSGHVRRHIQTW
ncbi:11193_t:CDS:1, partial [Paraglomus occultum]